METKSETWIFMSIFYGQINWHLLLGAARKTIELPDVSKKIMQTCVLFNNDRGESVRLALKTDHSQKTQVAEIIAHSLHTFLRDHPSETRPVSLPIRSFFCDFENNTIKYNLFNERLIMIGRLEIFQSLLSKLLLILFEDHPINDEGLFTLIVYLQKSILEGLCSTDGEKQQLVLEVSKLINRNGIKLQYGTLKQADYIGNFKRKNAICDIDIQTILSKFELAAKNYQEEILDKVKSFLTILNVIQLQLFKIDDAIFLEALDYLYKDINHQRQFFSHNQLEKQLI